MKNNKIVVYHRNTKVENKVEFDPFYLGLDYGEGCYCYLSEEYAKQAFSRYNFDFIFTHYSLDLSNLKTINFFDKKYNSLNWIATIAKYRLNAYYSEYLSEEMKYFLDNYSLDLTDIDLVIAPRTDHSNLDIIINFLQNKISIDLLEKNLEFSNKDCVYALISKKGLDSLTKIKHEIVESRGYYQKYLKHDIKIRNKLKVDLKHSSLDRNAKYIKDIKNMEIEKNETSL